MSRLTPLDKALLLTLVPLWAVCLALTASSTSRGDATSPPAFVSEPPTAAVYPRLVEIKRWAAIPSDLEVGDQLIRLGDADLQGVGRFGFFVTFLEAAARGQPVPVTYQRAGELRQGQLGSYSRPAARWASVAISLAFAFVAVALFLQPNASPVRRPYFLAFLCIAILYGSSFGANRFEVYASMAVQFLAMSLALPLGALAFQSFPNPAPASSGWSRRWPWLFLAYGPLQGTVIFGFPLLRRIALPGALAVVLTFIVWLLIGVTRKYRREDPIARRQLRWVLFGVYCALIPPMLTAPLVLVDSRFVPLYGASLAGAVAIPITFVVAVTRYNLFDIDRLLSAAASYNVVLAILGAGALMGVPIVATAGSELVGMTPGTGQALLCLALATVVVPAHRRLRPQIDRLFFRERYALDHSIAELLPTLALCRNARDLTQQLAEALQRILRPEACVVYTDVAGSYAPIFVQGRAMPPIFAAGSPLVASLQERRAPLALAAAGRRPDEAPASPFDRAALETLAAEVVVPVRRADALAAFVCLGPKRSGDVYTTTDLSLLSAVAETVSHQLQHFDQDAVIRESREMQESLRRYVPGAVAEQLESGIELTASEVEVSVLFVDIRGYTHFSESRRSEDIFSTLNQYTETVSRIVRRHGGSVVEFNGDGMMAVFGAPRELANKERAAVEAGRDIVDAVAALQVEDARGGRTKLTVGVGIATGEAFVGNIQAVDRMIWSAIGNTTNLAARLQSLSRELDAAIVIDSRTQERAPAAAEDFEKRPKVPIRGRRDPQDVYALPIRPAP